MTDKPQRIQRKRTKGWRMPDNTVYVGRPTKWGNPFKVGDSYTVFGLDYIRMTKDELADAYGDWLKIDSKAPFVNQIKSELKGKDLACWCSLDKPCHADILLRLANE